MDLTSAEVSTSKDEKQVSDVVATHYNKIEEVGIEARKESRIYYMRNFNNWTKSVVIGDFINRIKRNKGYGASICVLDIGCGKGGDLRKYNIAKISHLICTDIAETTLNQCRDRYMEMRQRERNQRRQRLFTAEFIHADSTRDILKHKYENKNVAIDLVSIQFSFHYCFESLKQADTMIRNASECLRVGGFLIGTTPDAYDIIMRMRQTGSSTFGNDIYSITFDESVADESKPLPLFGAQYNFKLDEVVDCPEFLVYFPVLKKIAARHGLKLLFRTRFDEYFEANKNHRENKDLLRRMQALETYPASSDKRLTGTNESDYVHAQNCIDNLNGSESNIATISLSEWEAISLYVVFAFIKESNHAIDQ